MLGMDTGGTPTTATGSRRRRTFAAIGLAVVAVTLLGGCLQIQKHTSAHVALSHSPRPSSTRSAPPATSSPSPEPTTPDANPAPDPAPNPAVSHAATPGPISASAPAPTLTSVPQGTIVAEGDVASPKGSIHFHYQMVANGDNTYSAQYSGFTSTVPVPISVTLLQIPPKVGDGLTYHGVGDHQLGGPTTTVAPNSSVSLGSVGQPSYLIALVTYSSATSPNGIPVELGPNKVLAVNTVNWSIPERQSNVHPVDGGSRTYASGSVTATTASGAPKRYLVAPDDITAVVAQRFGISVEDLIWLNANLQVFGSQQYLYEGTTLNLDPDSL